MLQQITGNPQTKIIGFKSRIQSRFCWRNVRDAIFDEKPSFAASRGSHCSASPHLLHSFANPSTNIFRLSIFLKLNKIGFWQSSNWLMHFGLVGNCLKTLGEKLGEGRNWAWDCGFVTLAFSDTKGHALKCHRGADHSVYLFVKMRSWFAPNVVLWRWPL